MISLGLILTVVAAAGWSGLDVARKIAVGRMKPETVLVWLVFGQTIPFLGWALWEGEGLSDPAAYLGLAAVSIALNVISNLTYLHAVRLSPFSLMIPLLSFVPVFTVAAANPLLGEMPSQRQLVGICIVVVGTLLLGAGPKTTVRSIFGGLLRERGTPFMLVTALGWALTMVIDKMALVHAPAGVHGVTLNLGIGIALVVWLGARGRLGELREVRGHEGVVAGAVAAGTVALGAQLLAVQMLLAGVVEAVKRAIGIVVAVFVGRLAFDEPITRAKLTAVVLMGLGTALVVV